MGAHTSLLIYEKQAREIYRKHVGPDNVLDKDAIESFFDRVLDERVYNIVLVSDEWENKDELFSAGVIESWTESYLKEHPQEIADNPVNENALLRRMLALRASGISQLYTDDGELQDSSERPFIDYKRDSAVEIQRKLHERATARLAREHPDFQLPER